MKTITLTQPWATLVACGEKKIETRSWNTHYRGRLYIHAAKRFPKEAQALCQIDPFRGSLQKTEIFTFDDLPPRAIVALVTINGFSDISTLPLGAIIAIVELKDVIKIDEAPNFVDSLSEQERQFGDYSKGRYAWLLELKCMIHPPVPAKGALGLWEYQSEV